MVVTVDRRRCQASGTCQRAAPEVFSVQAGELVVLEPEPGPELHRAVRDAARHCPTQAIRLTR